MKALIKINNPADDPIDVISEPFPDWLDPVAFSVFDCYGYAACNDYHESEDPRFTFSEISIENPFKQSEEDPDTVIMHIAMQQN